MRTVPTLIGGTLIATLLVFATPLSRAETEEFSVDGKTITGEIIDLVADGVFVAVDASGEVIPWDMLSSFQAKDIRIKMVTQLRNLRSGAVWVVGTVREVFPQGAVIYADARPRANYAAEINMPEYDTNKPRPRKSRGGAPAASGWYLVPDLPNAAQLVDETVQLIGYPNGNIEEIQLADENDPEDVPTLTVALPEWAGMRKWTNVDGVTIEAELIYVDGGNCIFEKDGTTMVYPLAKLSEADREIVQICEDQAKQVFIDPIAWK